jgi:hypothetical protein
MKNGRKSQIDLLRSRNAGAAGVLLALCLGWFGFAAPAAAEVRVAGSVEALKLEARNATLDEVLKTLRQSYKFNYRSAGALGGAVSGTYLGPLRSVVARLLDGRNYVIHTTSNSLDVSIFNAAGVSGSRPAVQMAPPPKDCKYDDGVRVIAVEC